MVIFLLLIIILILLFGAAAVKNAALMMLLFAIVGVGIAALGMDALKEVSGEAWAALGLTVAAFVIAGMLYANHMEAARLQKLTDNVWNSYEAEILTTFAPPDLAKARALRKGPNSVELISLVHDIRLAKNAREIWAGYEKMIECEFTEDQRMAAEACRQNADTIGLLDIVQKALAVRRVEVPRPYRVVTVPVMKPAGASRSDTDALTENKLRADAIWAKFPKSTERLTPEQRLAALQRRAEGDTEGLLRIMFGNDPQV